MRDIDQRIEAHAIRSLALIASFFLISCAEESELLEVADDWIEIVVGDAFTLRTPPDFTYVPSQGTDSFVGRIQGPDFDFSFDYGWYSSKLNNDLDSSDYTSRKIWIGDKQAKLVTFTVPENRRDNAPGTHHIGAYFPKVSEDRDFGDTKLQISAWVEDPKHYGLAEKILRTIEFP